ncbi:MAG TPA: VIT domain-containing protein, partial [Kofleriaceae bacterium]|nr:VIT domain-containing protein [Kofleriaceae bacterium]
MRTPIVFAGLIAACSGTKAPPPTPLPTTIPISIHGEEVSFAAAGSAAIAQAAMVYPDIATGEPPAPLSLTASDGTGLALEALEAQAVIAGPLAFTELRLRFRNPRDRVIEGRFAITLPPNAAISRLAMQIDGRWQEAEVVELQAARRAYEDFLHRRQDPALMEKEAGNEFSARIFPIPANGVKDIIISYSQELIGTDASYTLPLRGLPVIDQVSLRVLRGTGAPMTYQATTVEHRAWKPDADFSIPAGAAAQGLRAGELVVARVRPAVDATEASMAGAVLLFDTSASRAVGFAREVERFGQLVAALAARHPGLRVS